MSSPLTISQLQSLAHDTAKTKGFWSTNRPLGVSLCLIHSEISEALEADRQGRFSKIGEELADAMIRIADLAEHMHINLQDEIERKMTKNMSRPHKHGKAY